MITYGVVVAPVRVLHASKNMRLGLVSREASMDYGGGKRWMMVEPGYRHRYANSLSNDDENDDKRE